MNKMMFLAISVLAVMMVVGCATVGEVASCCPCCSSNMSVQVDEGVYATEGTNPITKVLHPLGENGVFHVKEDAYYMFDYDNPLTFQPEKNFSTLRIAVSGVAVYPNGGTNFVFWVAIDNKRSRTYRIVGPAVELIKELEYAKATKPSILEIRREAGEKIGVLKIEVLSPTTSETRALVSIIQEIPTDSGL